jgi:hypothetical protein
LPELRLHYRTIGTPRRETAAGYARPARSTEFFKSSKS